MEINSPQNGINVAHWIGKPVEVDGKEARVVGASDIGEDPLMLIEWTETRKREEVPLSRVKRYRDF